jgi:hypothetical protein
LVDLNLRVGSLSEETYRAVYVHSLYQQTLSQVCLEKHTDFLKRAD